MENQNIIEQKYADAVGGLTSELLNNSSDWYTHILNLSLAQQVVYTVIIFHNQVENGGFHQYFFNSYGQFAFLTAKNLKLIGATKREQLLRKALKEVNSQNLDEPQFRKAVFERSLDKIVNFDKELFDFLNDLDTQYYNMNDEDISLLLNRYLKG